MSAEYGKLDGILYVLDGCEIDSGQVHYSLKARLEYLGHSLDRIVIDNDVFEYEFLKRDIYYLIARIYVRLSPEFVREHNLDTDRGVVSMDALRYGTDRDWCRLLDTGPDDLRLTLKMQYCMETRRKELYWGFSGCHFGKGYIPVTGDIIDWPGLCHSEWEAENDYYGTFRHPYTCFYDTDELTAEAYENDLDAWICRNN